MRLTNKGILFFIIAVAAILRWYNIFDIPFTHDEFSALRRTYFTSFGELLEKGVKPDGHPAGIQVFLFYWIQLCGSTEWIVKLPFLLAGIGAVYVLYLIAKEWYTESVALMSAAFLATIQYTVMYSQIARPYISGMFICLLMVLYWTKLIKRTNENAWINASFYALFSVLAAYNHYFSLLFAVIVWLSGLFFMSKKLLVKYVLAGLLAFVLFLPHVKITMHQLGIGGVGGWLGKPTNMFLVEYLKYVFNYSSLVLAGLFVLLIIPFFGKSENAFSYRKLLLFGSWFLLPFLIGFYYSIHVNAVLQFSVLIFSFPFLYFILFGHMQEQKVLVNFVLVVGILAMNVFSLIYTRQHYSVFYKSPYEYLLKDKSVAMDKYESIASFLFVHDKITEYYIERGVADTNYFNITDDITIRQLAEKLMETESEYLFLGAMSGIRPTIIPAIKEFFPTIEWQHNYFNGTSYLFSRKASREQPIALLDFEKPHSNHWSEFAANCIVDTVSYSGNKAFYVNSDMEWCPQYSIALWDIIENKNNFIDVSVKIKQEQNCDGVLLAAALYLGEENIYWSSTSHKQGITLKTADNWCIVHNSLKLSDIDIRNKEITLKVFLWNSSHCRFVFDDLKIGVRKGNAKIYGLQQDL